MLRKAVSRLTHHIASTEPHHKAQSLAGTYLAASRPGFFQDAVPAVQELGLSCQLLAFGRPISTGASSLFPQAQTSEEAREKVDDVKEVDMTQEHLEQAQGSSSHPHEPEHAPNVDYLRQKDYLMMYPRYEKSYMESIAPKHQAPEKVPFAEQGLVTEAGTE